MVRHRESELAKDLGKRLSAYQLAVRRLPGIRTDASRLAFIEQVIESVRRIKYVSVIRNRPISSRRTDPNDPLFDPLKAAIFFQEREELDEAFWMVFIFVHFGKHPKHGWQYARRVYGKLGSPDQWDWLATSSDPTAFSSWLDDNIDGIKGGGAPGGFGNHRKYVSLKAHSENGTGQAFETYVQWVNPARGHQGLMDQAIRQANGDPGKAFDILYRSMDDVASFGRLARLDYLAMIGKLGLAPIEPGRPYLENSSGPLKGARVLFGKDLGAADLDKWAGELATHLDIGMQAMEDALCNWQKSPSDFIPFRG